MTHDLSKARTLPTGVGWALLAAVLVAVPGRVAADPIDDYLRAQMRRNHIPAVSLAVVRGGRVVKLGAYGVANLEWDGRAGSDTAFQLASATKPLTGTLLMRLVEEGKLALDAPVSRYLPDAPPAWDGVTIRHLATHTAGIPEEPGPQKIDTAAEAVSAAMKLPLAFRPGERSSYGLTGYMVLMHVMEKVAGQPFPVLLRERLAKPLGMKSTRFDNAVDASPIRTADPIPRRASVYNWEQGAQRVFQFHFPAPGYSAGGLYASAADLARWAAALDRGTLLRSASLEAMWTPLKLSDASVGSFGLGWAIGTYRGRRTAAHSGGPALADLLRLVDDRLTVIVLANQQDMYPYLAQGVADFYLPPAAMTASGIADRDLETTRRLKRLLEKVARGRVDPALFTPEAERQFVPLLQGMVSRYLASLDPLGAFSLLEETRQGNVRTRRYRAWYGKKPLVWSFRLTAEGKIASLQPTPE